MYQGSSLGLDWRVGVSGVESRSRLEGGCIRGRV